MQQNDSLADGSRLTGQLAIPIPGYLRGRMARRVGVVQAGAEQPIQVRRPNLSALVISPFYVCLRGEEEEEEQQEEEEQEQEEQEQ